MKRICSICIFLTLLFFVSGSGLCTEEQKPTDADKDLETIITGIEKRYTGRAFTARFVQQSTLKALEITDTASGRIFAKEPGMMRWEYETPDPQIIITDGAELWIYRPEDNQVMLGKAPTFFSGGKGAGFLSDIGALRRRFEISLEEEAGEPESLYRLKLLPLEPIPDVASIFLSVDRQSHDVTEVITYNIYEDETRIRFIGLRFEAGLDDAMFKFVVPENADVVQIDE
jgi:outer membrane lipoprotein carrier protein